MKASFVHTRGFRTFLWCVAIYACVFVIANLDNFQAMAEADADAPSSVAASAAEPAWQEGRLETHEYEALADEEHYNNDHNGLFVNVSGHAEPMGI